MTENVYIDEKGIHFETEIEYEYEQANLRMKKL